MTGSATVHPPLFIVLEGIDGAGTTTQAERLVTHLAGLGRKAHGTREPSQGPIGVLLRDLLRGEHAPQPGRPVDGRTMALLFAADRIDHLDREIEPQLAAGYDVVSDRYLLSSLAYQAAEAERQWVSTLSRAVRDPDLTLLLDVPVEVAALRRQRAARSTERYDADDYLARVVRNYRELALEYDHVVVIDGTGDVDRVGAAVARTVDRVLARIRAL